MYVSKYYTCEEIDQRLLQGYYDDFVRAGFGGTINEFWAFVLSIKDKVDKKEGYDLSKNDFTDELKAKLDGIEEKANYITKVSQLENDLKFQTDEDVKKAISDLVDGADDALDTLKELAEALGNDPNFATTITNKLTELRTALSEEVNRAKEAEASLGAAVAAVQDNLEYAVEQLINKIDTTKADLKADIDRVEKKADKNAEDIKDLNDKITEKNDELENELKGLIQKEKDERIAADNEIKESVNELKTLHINDKAAIESKIAEEVSNRTNADTILDSKINEEITNRQADTQSLQSKLDQEKVDRHSEDQVLHNEISKEVADRTNADNLLQGNIDKEAQARTSADQVLQNNIDSEATTRAAQDLVLDHKIEDVKLQGQADKAQLLEAIAAEATARENADIDLDNQKVDKREGYSLTKNDFTDILKAKLDGIEEKANYITHLSQLINDSGFQTEEEVEAAIQKIVGSAPEVLDTLKEIADALGNDPNFAATITKKLAAITEQVNKETEDRIAGDEANSAEVATEVQARKDADTALEVKLKEYIDNKSATGDAAIGVVRDNLNKEIQDRKDADSAIQATLDKEIADRKTADDAYNVSLTNVNKRISELALSIQDSINTLRNELTAQVNANTTAIATNEHNIERNSEAITNLTKTVGDNYKEVKDMINEEIVDRTNADSSLSSRIDTLNINLNTERVERTAADQVLQVNLDKEVADRTAADKSLSTEFTAKLDNTKQALESEVDKLNLKLDQEKSDRIAGDTALGARIDSLEAGNSSAMDELKAKVSANTTAINTEKDRAIAKETSLEAKIDVNLQNHKDDMAGINQSIITERNARLAGDTELQNNIDKEATERANQDTLINNALLQEKSDRIAADAALDTKKVDKVDGKVLSSNDFTDILFAKLNDIEDHANYITKVSELLNDSGFQTEDEVEAAIQKIIGSAPEVLDTLAEIAKALGDDPNFAATMTAKLTELENKLTAEKNLREQGDSTLQQSFTNLSTTLTTTVNDLRTFVSETRTELLTSLNATNALVTQNTANIQRNLELIQGIQDNINGNYTAITNILNNEIAARKAEDIRLEAKIDQNTSDLNTETEERKAADKVLQDNIDTEEAARIAADTALGKRIDKEITDRTNADTALSNRINAEVSERESEIERVDGRIDKEITDRTNADNTLQSNIDAEEAARIAADEDLQDQIDATNAHTINSYRLDSNPVLNGTDIKLDGYQVATGTTESELTIAATDTVSKAFGKVQKQITDNELVTATALTQLNESAGFTQDGTVPDLSDTNYLSDTSNLIQGLRRLDSKTKELDGKNDTEFERLDAKIDKEITDRSKHVQETAAAIRQEVAAADSALGVRITQETQARENADAALDTKFTEAVADEAKAREDADTALGTRITTETTNRTNADNALGARIDKEITDRTAADTALDTKLQNNINALEAKHDAFVATKGKANGFASLDANGTVPASQLPSYVDDIIEVYATYTVGATGGLTNIRLYSDSAHTKPITGESGKIYVNVTSGKPSYQFRWSGNSFVDSNTSSLIIGTVTGTAFDGARGKALEDTTNSLPSTLISNVGIYTYTNSSIILAQGKHTKQAGNTYGTMSAQQILLSAASQTQAGVMSVADKVKLDTTLPTQISNEITNRTDGDNAIKAVINTLPDKVVGNNGDGGVFESTRGSDYVILQYYVNKKSSKGNWVPQSSPMSIEIPVVSTNFAGIMTSTDKDNLDNTVTGLANEITDRTNAINSLRTELKTYIDNAISDTGTDLTALETKVNNHVANKANPHGVTKSQVGLGNASNTSDVDKPVSTAQATAIADAKSAGTAAQTAINNHAGLRNNPHAVTRAQLGLATTDNVVFAKTTAPSGFFKESSDIRLKSNLKDLNHTLEQICQIPTKSFEMLGKEDEGTIAQNLEALGFGKYVDETPVEKSTVPNSDEFETLEINGEEYVLVKQVKYHKMSTLAIEGIKLLYDEVKALKAEIQELKNK